jgi:hypothetical protein
MPSGKMIRVQAVLGLTGMETPAPFDDEWMFTACPQCGAAQSLGACSIRPEGPDTHYLCKNGCQDLVIVSRAQNGAEPWPGRGYRLGGYVVRNAVELVILVGPKCITLRASAAALLPDSRRPSRTDSTLSELW